MISILNSIFIIMFYMRRQIKLDLTYIYFKEFINQLNLHYIIFTYDYICNRTRLRHTELNCGPFFCQIVVSNE
jgi:hypothetical protein